VTQWKKDVMGAKEPLSWMLRCASCNVGGGSRECSELDKWLMGIGGTGTWILDKWYGTGGLGIARVEVIAFCGHDCICSMSDMGADASSSSAWVLCVLAIGISMNC
jgi:hypothetical protein